jgi:hypothetical protein
LQRVCDGAAASHSSNSRCGGGGGGGSGDRVCERARCRSPRRRRQVQLCGSSDGRGIRQAACAERGHLQGVTVGASLEGRRDGGGGERGGGQSAGRKGARRQCRQCDCGVGGDVGGDVGSGGGGGVRCKEED